MKIYKRRDWERILRESGFALARWKGGHAIWQHPCGVRQPLPHEWNGELSDGLCRGPAKAVERVTGTYPRRA